MDDILSLVLGVPDDEIDSSIDESNDYKVVAIPFWGRVKIYSLKSGCRKTLGDFPPGFLRRALEMFLTELFIG
ncbi:hypothetical protein Tco_1425664 [Tanacetum coccineum]